PQPRGDCPQRRPVRGRHQGQFRRADRHGRSQHATAPRRLHRWELPRRSLEAMTGIRSWTMTCAGDMPAFVAAPDASAKAPAVIVLHERYGLVRHTRDVAERFARDGFVAVAPDLFFRREDQEALHRGDVTCDLADPDALTALDAAVDAVNEIAEADPTR